MGEAFITRRGGGKIFASNAVLAVTVQTGASVTMTKDAVTLKPTMWVQAADAALETALFVISPSLFDAVNAWTVTAVFGTISTSKTLVVDSNKEYKMRLASGDIFRNGYQDTNLTGGFAMTRANSNFGYSAGDPPDGELVVKFYGTSQSSGSVYTVNSIDLTLFSTLYLKTATVTNARRFNFGVIASTASISYTAYTAARQSNTLFSLDIQALSGMYHICMSDSLAQGENPTVTRITELYLE